MVIKNNKLHIICWVCWTSKDFRVRIDDEGTSLTCNNCSTLTDLKEELGIETIEFKDLWKNLNWQCKCNNCWQVAWSSMSYKWSDWDIYCSICKDKIKEYLT